MIALYIPNILVIIRCNMYAAKTFIPRETIVRNLVLVIAGYLFETDILSSPTITEPL